MTGKVTAVRDRLIAAIALYKNENPGLPLAVSKICRLAGVNRANVYANHADLLVEFRVPQAQRFVPLTENETFDESNKTELESLRRQNKALIYLCLELQSSVSDLTHRQQAALAKKRK